MVETTVGCVLSKGEDPYAGDVGRKVIVRRIAQTAKGKANQKEKGGLVEMLVLYEEY